MNGIVHLLCRPASLSSIARVARLPGSLPWRIAPLFGTDPLLDVAATERAMARLFPDVTASERRQWLRRHCALRSRELIDAHNFSRLRSGAGITIETVGIDQALRPPPSRHQGTLLVLTHLDRFLAAPLALAARGVRLNMLTMPADHLPLPADYRHFLLQKIAAFREQIGGSWLTTQQPLLPLVKGLERGEWWIALPDAWEPTFTSFTHYPFLSGTIAFPSGLIRIAHKTRCRILYGETEEMAPNHLRVTYHLLEDPAETAFGWIAERLAQVLATAPWRWWQWPLLEQLWHPRTLN